MFMWSVVLRLRPYDVDVEPPVMTVLLHYRPGPQPLGIQAPSGTRTPFPREKARTVGDVVRAPMIQGHLFFPLCHLPHHRYLRIEF